MNLWDRRPKETDQAYEAKRRYVEMGVGRSCAKVGQELGKSTTLMNRWASQWQWVAAAAAYDQHMATVEQDSIAKERAKLAARMERMRWELPKHEMDLADKYLAVVDKLLALPHVRMKGKDGQTIAPANAQEFRAAADMGMKADDLRRRALGLPSQIFKSELGLLSLEQLQMLAALAIGDEGTNAEGETGIDTGGDGGLQSGPIQPIDSES